MDLRLAAISLGVMAGIVTRFALLRVDYRRYPSYPHGYITHLALGLVAAFLGAVAIPAIVDREYTAATFLALAATQFREIRAIEREKLRALDAQELVPRGNTYIEGIARVFEARNYLVMLVALATGLATELGGLPVGIVVGTAGAALAHYLRSGRELGDIAEIELVPLHFEGPALYVGDVYVMNIALPELQKEILGWGVGVLLRPLHDGDRETLDNVGQRQAVLHDVSAIMGARIDIATPELFPMARKNQETGTIALYLTPVSDSRQLLLTTIRRVPVLESAGPTSVHSLLAR